MHITFCFHLENSLLRSRETNLLGQIKISTKKNMRKTLKLHRIFPLFQPKDIPQTAYWIFEKELSPKTMHSK